MGKLIVIVIVAFFMGFYFTTNLENANQRKHCACKTATRSNSDVNKTIPASSLTDSASCSASKATTGSFTNTIEVYNKNGIIYLFW